MAKPCTVADCDEVSRWMNLCHVHAMRVYHRGTTELLPRPSVAERFWSRVLKTPGCWVWTGTLNTRSYGVLKVDGKYRGAHVISFEYAHGCPVTPGLVVGHVCHDQDPTCVAGRGCLHRRCVNPSHLEEMTRGENVIAGRVTRLRKDAA